jgi:hypothetical protein
VAVVFLVALDIAGALLAGRLGSAATRHATSTRTKTRLPPSARAPSVASKRPERVHLGQLAAWD